MSKDLSLENTLEEIRLGNNRVIKQVYQDNRAGFISWACKHFQQSEEQVNELYHESFLVFVDNLRKGKLTTLNCKISTYLAGVSKLLRKEEFRNKKREKSSTKDEVFWEKNEAIVVDTSVLDHYEDEHRKKAVRSLLKKISPSCQKLLALIFYKNYQLPEIVEIMEYSDERVARKRKSVCLKQLREIARTFEDKLH
ncbi:sigma-70 family RNA polymerase sigma factor [Saprospira sp. CCB-QB6]|uniref:RNA polymerase sigma factor n=1 Tax=Saprospira sp. CCB-QB6 TaxID=3023936 RepID=UPI00234B0551|nr:sigma-70 family RNA polymerase sigma factor [Saprospira sp. CCB-QB6]WCL80051.1 sigma-70 family RNA polymerase sigma factor [Saprospira sp. CCB-QB6]